MKIISERRQFLKLFAARQNAQIRIPGLRIFIAIYGISDKCLDLKRCAYYNKCSKT